MGSRPLQILVSGSDESGKSTLVGHLLYKCGHLSPETMKTLRKQKVEQGMSYRQLLQSLQVQERHATPWRRHYRSPKYEVIIIATPPCLSLLARRKVDCMLFVVSAAKREFEMGWSLTQKQIVSACKLPVKLLVVCVNKMDSSTPVPYNHHRYKDIVGKVFDWFWAWDREPRTVLFLPISALYGDNLQETSVKMLWFCKWEIARERGGVVTGTTLQQLLDAFPICHHRPDLPFAPLGPDPYSETKSTSKPRALDTPDSAESPLGPRPPKSPRRHPPSGRLGRSSGYKLCPSPPRTTRYKLPPRFSRSFKHDPDPGPSTSSSRQDPCPGTSRNSRPDSHPGPSTSGSRFELHPRPSGSSGHNLPGAGLERRPGSPIPLSSPAAGSDTGVSPEEEEEDTCSTGVPTQPPSAMASWENLIGPPLLQYPTPGLPGLLPSPFPFPSPLPRAQIQQEPSFPLPDPVYQLPLLGEASWAPVSATLPPPLQSPPASFPLQDPPTQQAQPPPYSPPFQQPPAQAIPFFSQPFVPPGSFRAPPGPQGHFVFPPPPGAQGHFAFPPPPGPEGHFVFPPPATQAFPNPSPQTPYYAQDFPRAFGRSGPFSLYSFPWHGTSAYPLGIKMTLEPTSWPRRFWEWKPLPQPSKPESLLPQPPPATAPPLPPRPPSLAGPDPDGIEALSSAASLAPKPTPQPGSPSSSPPKALPQTPRQPPPLGTGPLPPLISCMAPSGTGDQATRLPPPTLPAASSLPSGSPPQLPGPPSQPGSPGLQTSQHSSDSPPRLLNSPPPLIPILPPLSPFPLPSVPGAPDPLGNRPPPLAASPHPHGAPRPATASLQQSLVHMSPPGHSPLSPPKPHSPSPTSPSSSL